MGGILRDHAGVRGRLGLGRFCRLYMRVTYATCAAGVAGVFLGTCGLRWATFALFGLALLLQASTVALVARRLHDRGLPGWLAVASLGVAVIVRQPLGSDLARVAVVGAGAILQLWLVANTWFLRGDPGPNRHGPDPLGETVPPAAELESAAA